MVVFLQVGSTGCDGSGGGDHLQHDAGQTIFISVTVLSKCARGNAIYYTNAYYYQDDPPVRNSRCPKEIDQCFDRWVPLVAVAVGGVMFYSTMQAELYH